MKYIFQKWRPRIHLSVVSIHDMCTWIGTHTFVITFVMLLVLFPAVSFSYLSNNHWKRFHVNSALLDVGCSTGKPLWADHFSRGRPVGRAEYLRGLRVLCH